jgi:hypothetical protein
MKSHNSSCDIQSNGENAQTATITFSQGNDIAMLIV